MGEIIKSSPQPEILPMPRSMSPPIQCKSPPQHNHNSQPAFTIKTSKKWVLPPRPKPGRKPTDDHDEKKKKKKCDLTGAVGVSSGNSGNSGNTTNSANSASNSTDNTTSTTSSTTKKYKKKSKDLASKDTCTKDPSVPKSKRGRKSKLEKLREAELSSNPLKQAILKINEENYYLKLEVIKLVSDLKSLKSETTDVIDERSPVDNSKTTTSKSTHTANTQAVPVSVPMNHASTSRTNNNNTIYRIHSNSSTNASTPMMSNASLSPSTVATTPPSTATTHGKKRAHDEDINDLILSLIDLNHSNELGSVSTTVSPLTSNNLNSFDSEQSVTPATSSTLKHDKRLKLDSGNTPLAGDSFNCTNFLNFDDDDDLILASSPHDSIDIESLTPDSLLSLSKTNSTIEDLDLLDGSGHHGHHHQFSPKLIDIPEIPIQNNVDRCAAGNGYDFQFWKQSLSNGSTENGAKDLKLNVVFNTNSTIDELIMERQRQREAELLSYNELNDLIDFEQSLTGSDPTKANAGVAQHVVFNDDWRLDDDDLLNF